MEKVELKVLAKINVQLDILGRTEEGYHTLDMLATSIDIGDTLVVKKSTQSVVYMNGEIQDSSNTAVKALELLEDAYGYKAEVYITKEIPYSAGLGGSSADAAGVFYAYGHLYEIDKMYMTKLAQSVGCDVVYMMQGGPSIIRGVGEIVMPIPNKIDLNCIVAQKKIGASTKDVYQTYDKIGKNADICRINQDLVAYNALEKAATYLDEEITQAKKDLLKFTDKVFMTGSGSAFVAVFDDQEKMQECFNSLDGYIFKKCCQTKDCGIVINSIN